MGNSVDDLSRICTIVFLLSCQVHHVLGLLTLFWHLFLSRLTCMNTCYVDWYCRQLVLEAVMDDLENGARDMTAMMGTPSNYINPYSYLVKGDNSLGQGVFADGPNLCKMHKACAGRRIAGPYWSLVSIIGMLLYVLF